MDDKNQNQNHDLTPDQTPEPTAASAPDAPTVPVAPAAASDATAQYPAAGQHPAPAAPAADAPKPRRTRALLIGGGIAAAVLLAGGGIAVGAAIGDEFGDDDDRSSVSDDARHDDAPADRGDQRGDRDDDGGAGSNRGAAVTGIGTASADELVAIADAARRAAEGDVTSIDAKRDGTWEVQLTAANGDETDVRVDADLGTSIVSTDAADGDDTGPALILDEATIRSLVAAALDEADGMITDLDVDSDDVSPYDASVLTTDNRSIDIDFDSAFAVVGTDIDD
ncbi:hypothetical protein [Microbacterium sp. LWO12-1.2]|uniref:hypothetical protein n=1 Tax=Microbacterium sp. LWO12-1.2 TaxID=3135261 RepID=UPI00342B3455